MLSLYDKEIVNHSTYYLFFKFPYILILDKIRTKERSENRQSAGYRLSIVYLLSQRGHVKGFTELVNESFCESKRRFMIDILTVSSQL